MFFFLIVGDTFNIHKVGYLYKYVTASFSNDKMIPVLAKHGYKRNFVFSTFEERQFMISN